ncbi:MAG: MerR family transcriptional regulator [Desulfatitalea sp.]
MATIDTPMKNLLESKTIQLVSQQLQLPKSTIRYWEKEFAGIVTPERTPGGQRRYSTKDVAVLQTIRDLKADGLSLVQIKKQLMDRFTINKSIDPLLIDRLTQTIAGAVSREIYNLLKQGS